MAARYPEYCFEKHKGYGTKLHYEMIEKHGPSELHRTTFLRKKKTSDVIHISVGNSRVDTRRRGKWGEALALKYLEAKNYSAVAEGFRSRFGEIDLIVKDSRFIVFVEVKLRKSPIFATASEYVGREKQGKLRATANLWLSSHKPKLQPRFDIIEIYAPEGEDTVSPEIIHIENAF